MIFVSLSSDLNTKAGAVDTKPKTIELVNNEVLTTDIKGLILTVRGKQVLLDSDVARLYGYETKAINQTVKRNIARFPERYRFQLTLEETEQIRLRSQIMTLNPNSHMWCQTGITSSKLSEHENLRSQFVTSSSSGDAEPQWDKRPVPSVPPLFLFALICCFML